MREKEEQRKSDFLHELDELKVDEGYLNSNLLRIFKNQNRLKVLEIPVFQVFLIRKSRF